MTKRPNVLLFLVDELRYPTVYDSDELKAWMQRNLKAQSVLRRNGVDFSRHYVQSAACAPSRTSIFTGQYPSLHGVAQTDGIGKSVDVLPVHYQNGGGGDAGGCGAVCLVGYGRG